MIARTSDAKNETDVNFFARTFSLLARYEVQEKTKFSKLILVKGFPAGVTAGNKPVIPLDIDLLAWTPQIAAQITNFRAPRGTVLYLSGRATKLSKQQIAAAGLVLREDSIPGFYQKSWRP